ncbi:MAG: tetratricopeptide repeat protein [Candidatus Eisenbacteria bacterium]
MLFCSPMAGFLKECLSRRVPQYVGAYLLVVWGVVQFVSFIEERYRLSGPLVEIVAGLLLLLLPTVVILAWSQGRPGKDPWSPRHLVSVLVNVGLAVAVLFALFRGEEIGAVTRTVEVVDENGQRIEREIPRAQSIERVAIVPYQVLSTDELEPWVGWAAADLIVMDLYQSLFVEIRSPLFLVDLYREDHFAVGRAIPRAKLLEVAQEQHCDWLVTGTVEKTASGYRFVTELISPKTGATVNTIEASGEDLYTPTDETTPRLLHAIGVPDWAIEELVDLPSRETHTDDDVALRQYFLGQILWAVDRDFPAAAQLLDAAAERDPTFTLAHVLRFGIHAYLQNVDISNAALQAAIDHQYRLPERTQFSLRTSQYLNLERDPERGLAVAQMWSELYPNDLDALRVLAQLHSLRGETDDLVRDYERMLEIDPGNADALTNLGRAEMLRGNWDGAESAFRRYAELNPKDWRSHLQIGEVFERQGRFEDARHEYEDALSLELRDVNLRLRIASVQERLGDFGQANETRERALASARTADDSLTVYAQLVATDRMLGKYERAYETHLLWDDLAARTYNLLELAARRIQSLDVYVDAGRSKEGRAMLEKAAGTLDRTSRPLVAMGESVFLLDEKNWEGVFARCDELDAAGAELNLNAYHRQALVLRAEVAQETNDVATGIEAYRQLDQLRPGTPSILRGLGHCLREAGAVGEALPPLNAALSLHPYHPETQLELGKTYLVLGDRTKALAHLNAAASIWKDADPGHEGRAEAEELVAALETS